MKYPPNWIVTMVSRMTPAMLRDASVMRHGLLLCRLDGVLAVRATGRRRRGRASVRGSADEAASEIIRSPLMDSVGIRLWILILSMAADRKASDADRGTQQGH